MRSYITTLSPNMASRKLKVGFVIDTNLDSNDGVQQYVKRLGSWLSAEGHDVQYLTSDSTIKDWSGGPVHSLARKVTVNFNANRITMPLWPRLRSLKRLLEANDFDILHVQAPYSPLLAQQIINRADRHTAVVGTFHIMPTNQLQALGTRLLRSIYGRSLKRFDEFIAVSPAAADFAKKTLGIQPAVIPNPVDTKAFLVNTPRPAGPKKRIVFLGRLVERKGAQWLLEAVEVLSKQRDDLEVIIAGGGPLRPRLESYVASHQLQKIVNFTGFIDEADKPALLHSADVASFPAMYGEAFGIVLIEAMAAGAGVVLAGDNPGYRSVLGQQPKMLIESRDIQGFAARLEELLDNSGLTSKLHAWQNGQIAKYDTSTVGKATLEVYRWAIAKHANS